jgi:hypothetical protein
VQAQRFQAHLASSKARPYNPFNFVPGARGLTPFALSSESLYCQDARHKGIVFVAPRCSREQEVRVRRERADAQERIAVYDEALESDDLHLATATATELLGRHATRGRD